MPKHTPPSLNARASVLTLPFTVGARLRYSPHWAISESASAADIFRLLPALRDNVVTPGHPRKIRGFGPVAFNTVCEWLADCGYPIDAFDRIPVPTRGRARRDLTAAR